MKKPPYPALVKPDAVVLLPPEESEERQPRGLWPEPRRRSPWTSVVVVGVIFAAGLGLGLRLASRAAPVAPEAPEPVEGFVQPAPGGGSDDVGAMDAAAAAQGPEAPSSGAATGRSLTDRADGVTSAPPARSDAPARQEPAVRPVREAEPEPGPERLADAAGTPPATAGAAADTAALELAPAPVARTVIQPAEAEGAPVPSPLALEPPAPDPAAVRAKARESLSRGAERFAAAVAQVRSGSSGAYNAQVLASDAAARALLQFARDAKPTATVAQVGDVTVRDGVAQADAVLQLEWRGDFGVTRRGRVRVRLLARESAGDWRVSGVQPLEGTPR